MRAWVEMLGGLLVWAAHFVGVYALASLADVAPGPENPAWRVGIGVFSLLCLLSSVALGLRAIRRLRRPAPDGSAKRLIDEVAATGAGIAALSIAWQTLPALIPA